MMLTAPERQIRPNTQLTDSASGDMELNNFGLCMGRFLEHKKVVAAQAGDLEELKTYLHW